MKFLCGMLMTLCVLLLTGCGKSPSAADSSLLAAAGVPPVAYLAERIAGVPVISILPEGRSPHDFTPRPADIRRAAGAKVFLSAGMPFEAAAAKSLAAGHVAVADVTKSVERIPLEAHEHGHEHAHDREAEEHHHRGGEMDPHVWMSPANACKIAESICEALSLANPGQKEVYVQNCARLTEELIRLDGEIRRNLAGCQGRTFFVYHSAFGYFAEAYGLRQESVELGGREPSPSRLAEVSREARKHKVKTIFVQPQFNPAASQALARAIGGSTAELDPLQRDLSASFRRIAEALSEGFSAR